MTAEDPGRGDVAELARLLPVPAERDLRARRQQILKEHLMSELRLATSPPTGMPAPRRRRRPAVIAAIAAIAVAAAATVLALQPRNTAGPTPAVTRLLAKIASAAAAQPSPHVRDNQFWYIKSWVSYLSCGGGSGNNCTLEKPHERQVWMSVANQCIPGLLREYGQDTPLTESSGCPYRGDIHDPTYRFLQSLPTDPRALLDLIDSTMQGQLPRPEEAFTTIGDLIGEAIVPSRVSATLYRAAGLIPGVNIVDSATDAIGRQGIAVAMTFRGVRTEWIFSKKTFQYLGERDVNVANGSSAGVTAVMRRAFVNHLGQLPG